MFFKCHQELANTSVHSVEENAMRLQTKQLEWKAGKDSCIGRYQVPVYGYPMKAER